MHRAQTIGAVLVTVAAACAAAVAQGDRPALPRAFGTGVRTVITPASVWRLILDPAEQPWRPEVNRERSRGGAADLYPKVAPAVVVVRTDSGHGTGFLIDDRGTIVTNHHVVEEGLRHDAARRASYAMVHLGTLSRDGFMTLQPDALRAYVYKIDAARDLALLRVDRAAGGAPLPFLPLADAGARPGVPIAVVGHPAAGMLWTVRSGEVASVGRMPADMVNTVMTRLSAADSRRDDIASALARLASLRIILTSAGINPGDSGGPVLDGAGRVVAVTFAVPSSPSLAKFSYHIHLDELKAFLQDVPAAPRLVPPDPWALGPQVALDDLDGDKRPDVLLSGDEEPETFLFDLDNDSPLASVRDLDDLVTQRKWDFEAGLRTAGDRVTAFYDADGDGTIDLVLVAGADAAHHARFTRDAAGRWEVATGAPLKPIAGSNLRSPALAARFDALVAALVARARQAGG